MVRPVNDGARDQRFAQAYDLFTRAAFLGQRDNIYRRLARDAGIMPGDRVLDLGCGPGQLTRAAAALAGSTGQVIGLDASPGMVAYATRQGGEYVVGDAARPGFTDASFDVVVSALALHHVAWGDRDEVFRQAKRLLVPGGRLLVAEFVPPFGALGMAVMRGFGEQIADLPRQDLVERMQRAGFTEIATSDRGVLTVVRGQRPVAARRAA